MIAAAPDWAHLNKRNGMNTMIKLAWAAVVAAGLAGGAAQAQQSYPNKAVKFIVTYPPGGSSDVMARIIGKQLTEYWGQQVLVDSRPGIQHCGNSGRG
jgi:tripartite-type tricarboxylate transporter receptor subunit TctC